jgi:hypothetical protein
VTEEFCAYISARKAAWARHEVFQRLVGVPIAQREGMGSSKCSKVLRVVLVVDDGFWDTVQGKYVQEFQHLLSTCVL